jgi:hypothetical protein
MVGRSHHCTPLNDVRSNCYATKGPLKPTAKPLTKRTNMLDFLLDWTVALVFGIALGAAIFFNL